MGTPNLTSILVTVCSNNQACKNKCVCGDPDNVVEHTVLQSLLICLYEANLEMQLSQMTKAASPKVSPLTASNTAEESHRETKADKKSPMSEKSKADGKRKDLEDSVGEEQE